MPMTIVNWLSETRRPRHSAGLISAIYMGETLEASPMAEPPTILQKTNPVKVCAQPVKTEETANRKADRIRVFLRPKRSVKRPEASEPTRQPSRAQLLAQPMSCLLVS